MITIGQSDLASAMKLSDLSSRTKSALEVSSGELASGMKSNLVEATAGDLSKLFAIDRSLSRLSSEADAIQLAAGKSALAQISLGEIHDSLVDFGPQLLSAVERRDSQSSILIAGDARNALGAVVTSLNARYGRHSIFSGAALDQQAIASSEVIIGDISAIVTGSVDAATALVAIDDYFFGAMGGYKNGVFLGAAQDGPPLRDASGESVEYSQRADSFEIRSVIRALAIAAVASDAPNFMGTPDQTVLLREAGSAAISATGGVTALREKLGFAEGRIEAAVARNSAMNGVFELERSAIISIDLYEAATKFEALQVQLQTIYTITARLSGLSLTNFLR